MRQDYVELQPPPQKVDRKLPSVELDNRPLKTDDSFRRNEKEVDELPLDSI